MIRGSGSGSLPTIKKMRERERNAGVCAAPPEHAIVPEGINRVGGQEAGGPNNMPEGINCAGGQGAGGPNSMLEGMSYWWVWYAGGVISPSVW